MLDSIQITAAQLAADDKLPLNTDMFEGWGKQIAGIICVGLGLLMLSRAHKSRFGENLTTIGNVVMAGFLFVGAAWILVGEKIVHALT